MLVRCTGKFTIAVGLETHDETIKSIKNLDHILEALKVKHKLYLKKHLIITDNVIIKFIFKKHYSKFNRNIYGIKCNGCYGFNDEESYNITNGHNKCKDFTLIDYILRGERNG